MGRPMSPGERIFIVTVLRDATVHVILLSDFERSFIYEMATAYARFGEKLHTSDERLGCLRQIAAKLNTNLHSCTFIPDEV